MALGIDQKLIEDLTKSIDRMNRNVEKQSRPPAQGGGSGRGPYNTTRFTTPDVGGFRAFFSTAIGDSFIEAVEKRGFKNALVGVFEKFTGGAGPSSVKTIAEIKQETKERRAELLGSLMDPATRAQTAAMAGLGFTKAKMELEEDNIKLQELGQLSQIEHLKITKAGNKVLAQRLKLSRNMLTVTGLAILGMLKFRDSLLKAAQTIGGVSLGDAFRNRIDAFFQSAISLLQGRFVGFGEIERTQGSFSREFGFLINAEEARRQAQLGQDLGLTVQQLVTLRRALQGTGRSATEAINQFRDVGVVGSVAAEEIAKNADSVARAGDNFNRSMVQSIANTKKLGIEWSKIDQTLGGMAMDFGGTIESFANLRSVLPGFAVDFQQLMETAVFSEDPQDYLNIIKQGLASAGITSASKLNRVTGGALQQATGLSESEINRLLGGNDDIKSLEEQALELQKKTASSDNARNEMLRLIVATTSAMAGASVGGIFGKVGAGIGAILGGGIGLYAANKAQSFDDFVFRPGSPPIKFNAKDTLVGMKRPELLGATTGTGPGLEQRMDRLIMAIDRQNEMLSSGLSINMKNMDRALLSGREGAMRNM